MNTKIPRRKLGTARGFRHRPGLHGHVGFLRPQRRQGQSLEVLNHALDIGVNFLDTADMYGVGANERLLGQVLRTRRKDVVLATKFGNVRAADGAFLGVNGRPEYVRRGCRCQPAAARRRSRSICTTSTASIATCPSKKRSARWRELVEAGKVQAISVCPRPRPQRSRRAAKVHPIAALQSEYSLWTRDVESDVLPVCRELGIGFVAYSPLGRGFLTGAIKSANELAANDWRRQNPRFQGENLASNLALVEAVNQIARARGCTPAQLALAWLLSRAPDIVPIPGTRRIARLEENAGAAAITLTDAEQRKIEAVLRDRPVAGTRYPEANMASVNV